MALAVIRDAGRKPEPLQEDKHVIAYCTESVRRI